MPERRSPAVIEPLAMGWAWRHPRPVGAEGRCVGGGTDLPVPARKAKRLAHRIRAHARRHHLPSRVRFSPLRRCADVGRWLARWGWTVHIDARLREAHFGAWEGRPWSDIDPAELAAWTDDFEHHHPGGGESVHEVLQRVAQALAEDAADPGSSGLWITHGGCLSAIAWLQAHAGQVPLARQWPIAPPYAAGRHWARLQSLVRRETVAHVQNQ